MKDGKSDQIKSSRGDWTACQGGEYAVVIAPDFGSTKGTIGADLGQICWQLGNIG